MTADFRIFNRPIYIIIPLFLLVKLITAPYYNVVWWDSSVYLGMGKYIYSLGNAGLWEDSRPIVWPVILGLFWKVGLNPVAAGRIAEIIFGSLCILLTYSIGEKIFNRKTALLSSILLALSPTFFYFSGIMLTETVSTFFSLTAIYLFIRKKYIISGAFFGTAFMMRFLQLFVFAALILLLFISYERKNFTSLKKLLLGFSFAALPFLVLNQFLYNNAIFPFLQQIYLSKNSGWMNHHAIDYYFIGLFKENILYLMFIPGLLLAFKHKTSGRKLIALAFIVTFVFFNLIKQKEMRFLIILFPYMYLLVSSAIFAFFDNFKIPKTALYSLIFISIVLSSHITYDYHKNEFNKTDQYAFFQDILEKTGSNEEIWISSPVIAAFSDKKIGNLMYYPVFNEKKKNELLSGNADFIFIDSCDLSCRLSDAECAKNKDEIISNFKKRFKTAHSFKGSGCEQFVFAK